MGAFNTLTADASCPVCGRRATFDVQFKYGEVWQHEYGLGEQLKWGGTKADRGTPGHRRVLVEGIGGQCPHCGTEYPEFVVVVEWDKITDLKPSVQERVPFGVEGYIIET